eukprot:2779609-Pyramimonas_sp.AAC.1
MPTISELRKKDATPAWSAEAMMQAYTGTDTDTKRAFVEDMEATLDQNWDELLDLANRTSADFLIEKLDQLLIEVGQQYFERDPEWDERYRALRERRMILLKARRDYRLRHDEQSRKKEAEIIEEFKKTISVYEKQRDLEWKAHQEELLDQIWDCWRMRNMAE